LTDVAEQARSQLSYNNASSAGYAISHPSSTLVAMSIAGSFYPNSWETRKSKTC